MRTSIGDLSRDNGISGNWKERSIALFGYEALIDVQLQLRIPCQIHIRFRSTADSE